MSAATAESAQMPMHMHVDMHCVDVNVGRKVPSKEMTILNDPSLNS